MANFQKMRFQDLVVEAERLFNENQRLTALIDLDLINERAELVRKCNELSLDNSRLKKDLSDINAISNQYPEIVRSVNGKVIIGK